MKIDNREFLKISFIYTAVAAFPPVLNLIVRPLIEGSDKLNPTDFSQIEIAETITSLAFIIAIYAMGNAISRFYYDVNDNKSAYNKLVSSIFSSIIIRGIFILGIAFIFRNYIGNLFSQPGLQNFSEYGFASIIVGINRAVNMTAFALYRNEKKVRLFLILNLVLGFLRSAFQLIGVFYYDMSFIGYVYGNCIGSSLVTIMILVYTYNRSGVHLNFKILNNTNSFARPLFQYTLIAWGINFADRYFLEGMPAELGIYSQAIILGRGIEIILQGLQGASQPEMFRLMKDGIEKNQGEIKKLSNMLMAQTQVIIAITIIPAMLYCLVFKTDLRLAAGFIAIIFIRYLLRTQYIIFSFPVYYEKKTKIFLYLNIIVLAINLLLLYLLIPVMGIYGAIVAFFVSQVIQTLGIFYYQKRITNIKWNVRKLLIFPMIIILLSVLFEIAKFHFNLNEFISATFVVLSIFTGIVILYRKELSGILSKGWKQLLSTGK
ncbi:MAG: polysaccharide biosynthesis C-terminal domain-containing protein [Bacteroidales bacterium]|nr:polysaccharide biosynthesis C-terminal domain-containing protein [Bacteroidales bacterium]